MINIEFANIMSVTAASAPPSTCVAISIMITSLINRHFQKQLTIRPSEVTPSHLWYDIKEHLALRFHDPKNPGAFNVLQKIAYATLIFILLPVIIFTGLGMSPGINASMPWILDLFGGRASARSIHFLAMCGIVGFIVVHLALVVLAGPIREVGVQCAFMCAALTHSSAIETE